MSDHCVGMVIPIAPRRNEDSQKLSPRDAKIKQKEQGHVFNAKSILQNVLPGHSALEFCAIIGRINSKNGSVKPVLCYENKFEGYF